VDPSERRSTCPRSQGVYSRTASGETHGTESYRSRWIFQRELCQGRRNAVAEAAKTVRSMKWARVAEFEMLIEGKKIAEYRATARIYFDIER
jgi:flavin-binding protein dodecin